MITSRVSIVSARTVGMFVADSVCAGAALVLATSITFGPSGSEALFHDLPRLLVPTVLVPLAFALCGLYSLRPSVGNVLRRGLVPLLVCLATAGAYTSTFSPTKAVVGVATWFVALLVPAVLLVRAIGGWVIRHHHVATRAVVVGSIDEASRVVELVRRHENAGIRLLGLVSTKRHLDRPVSSLDGLPLLGAMESLENAVVASRADVILLGATLSESEPDLLRRLRALRLRGVAILDYLGIYERLAREIPLEDVTDEWLFAAAMSCSRLHIRWLKRCMDASVCILLAVPAAILFALAAVAIRLTSPGPVLFRQERMGLGGKSFWLLKLRTMRTDAEKLTGPVWSTDNDPRVTKIGRILRKFRIDELPQIVNVLRGDMSLVGPRPERPILARQICEKVPLFPERLLVRPGITGWAQVMAPYASTVADSHRKLQFDLYYIKNLSFWLDMFIIAKTASTMIFGRERTQGGLVAGRQLEPVNGSSTPLPRPTATEIMPAREKEKGLQISQAS